MPRPPRTDPALRPFHPIVRRWFAETLGVPSEPQRQGWPAIASGASTLILAPTGTGKTLTAFLWELNALIVEGLRAPLANAVHLLYVSPLKALNNDIQRNLERPLAELRARFEEAGEAFPEIRVAVRTGDTPARARARMTRVTPHILITTPESLHILLTSVRGRGMFSALRAVIIDEIHAVAGTKRGAHLALTMERLEHQVGRAVQRIGLSATQRPLEEIARYLVGTRDSALGTGDAPLALTSGETNRPWEESRVPSAESLVPACRIIDCGLVKAIETRIVSPVPDLGDVGGTVWPAVYPVLVEQIRAARTTLVFVNNRAQAERIAAKIDALAGEELALPYHGSLSRERRLVLEQRLKAGELRALVTTSSLELGIDVGSVDLVVQLQSPKRVANALQRIGRAGHSLGAVSRGTMVPTHLDDAMEMAAIASAMREGDVEPTRVVQNALDVLAQVIVAAVSVDDWRAAELHALVRRAYPYHRLSRAAFDEVLAMLSGSYPSDLAAELAPRIAWDRVNDRLSGSRASRLTAVVSGGTIPDRGYYAVVLPDRTRLGELDEEFVHESRIGDVFQLGSTTWRIGAIEHDRVVVTPAPGAPARMPFWHGEHMARSAHLAPRVGALRRELASIDIDDPAAVNAAALRHDADHATVRSLAEYVREQRAATGIVPDDRVLVLESFRDETNAVRLVLHAPFGARVNAPWGMAIAQRVREMLSALGSRPSASLERRSAGSRERMAESRESRTEPPDVQVQTTDDGIMLRLPDLGGEIPYEAFLGLDAREAERRVVDEVGSSSLFGAHFRMNAARALLLSRGMPNRRMPLWLQRLKSLDLLETVREWPSFPILVETYRDVLQDAFDMPALARVLDRMAAGEIRVETVALERPSPFSSSLQFGFVIDWLYGDDTPRAERRATMLSLDRALLDELMGAEGADEDTLRALAEVLAVRRGTAPRRRARTADELAVLVDRAGDVTEAELRERVATDEEGVVGDPIAALLADGRMIGVDIPVEGGRERRYLLTERWARLASAFGEGAVATVWTTEEIAREAEAAREAERESARRKDGSRPRDSVPGIPAPRSGAGGVPPHGEVASDYRPVRHRLFAHPIDPSHLVPAPAAIAIPEPLRHATLARGAAARELLLRWLSLAGPVSVEDVRRRYRFPGDWVRARLDEWVRAGTLVRGTFGTPGERWCARRVLEHARRRALAAARAAIEAVPLSAYVAFLQRWQHLDPRDRTEGAAGVERVARQMYGLARPAGAWERDYLPARVERYDAEALSRLAARGELVWIGGGAWDESAATWVLSTVRFVERGTEREWRRGAASPRPGTESRSTRPGGSPAASSTPDASELPAPLSPNAARAYEALRAQGASFLANIERRSGLGQLSVREALRELVAAGLATNDTMDALREVVRLRPAARRDAREASDPTRWLPADFTPSPGRPIVQRRPNPRRLAKWRRPDLPDRSGWVGRWSLVDYGEAQETSAGDEPLAPDEAGAERVARQMLERYGIVAREMWRRDRPAASWRAIYQELRRLEYRGEIRRGYFVRGLGGAQFALPEAVEAVREAARDDEAPVIVMATSDPADAYALDVPSDARDPLSRPRGRGALLVTRAGRVLLSVEGRGRRIAVAPGLVEGDVAAAARALAEHLVGRGAGRARARDLIVERIDDGSAARSPWREAFRAAGYRSDGSSLRVDAPAR